MVWANVVEDIRSGDERGAEILYSAVSECARPQLFQRVDPQLVDDYLQDILMIVMAAIRSGELRDPLCLMGFVRTVTRRQVAVYIRGAIVTRRRLTSVDGAHPPATPAHESPEARLNTQERVAKVHELLACLCIRDREILVRFYYEEEEAESICREMRLTPTQFRLYKSRALAKCGELNERSHKPLQNHSTKPLRIA